MTKRTKILLVGGLILFGQMIYFRDYISPFHWGQLKVTGLACTCPDEAIVNGAFYLRTITPDSLKRYDLDYSEIYVTEKPATKKDPMGADLYLIKGQVIGKGRVREKGPWNLKFRVSEWKEIDVVKDWAIKLAFFGQILLLLLGTSRTVIKKRA